MKQVPKALFMLSMYDIFCSCSIAMPLTLLEKKSRPIWHDLILTKNFALMVTSSPGP